MQEKQSVLYCFTIKVTLYSAFQASVIEMDFYPSSLCNTSTVLLTSEQFRETAFKSLIKKLGPECLLYFCLMRYQKGNILNSNKSEHPTESEVTFETYSKTSAYRKQISNITRELVYATIKKYEMGSYEHSCQDQT